MGERSEVGVLEGTKLPLYARAQPANTQLDMLFCGKLKVFQNNIEDMQTEVITILAMVV